MKLGKWIAEAFDYRCNDRTRIIAALFENSVNELTSIAMCIPTTEIKWLTEQGFIVTITGDRSISNKVWCNISWQHLMLNTQSTLRSPIRKNWAVVNSQTGRLVGPSVSAAPRISYVDYDWD